MKRFKKNIKRFKERIILFPEQEIEPKLLYLIPIAFWFPTKTTMGTEVKYWKGTTRNCKQNDEHISSLLKHMRMKNEKI